VPIGASLTYVAITALLIRGARAAPLILATVRSAAKSVCFVAITSIVGRLMIDINAFATVTEFPSFAVMI